MEPKLEWSNKEIEILRVNYPTVTRAEISNLLPNRKWRAIELKANRLGLKRSSDIKRPQNWAPRDLDILERQRANTKRYKKRHPDRVKLSAQTYRKNHREELRQRALSYHATHKEQERARARKHYSERYQKDKELVFRHYGNGKCECCGESRQEFLTINHKNGGGNKHRKQIGLSNNLYHWLVQNNFPDGFNVLCMNCNWASRITGACPHSKDMLKLEKVSEDIRGETYHIIFKQDNKELMLIHSKGGFFRGGHSHSKPEISLILTGKVRNWKIVNGEEVVTEKAAGEFMINQAGEPHLTLALEDFWLIDWKIDAHIGEWTTTNYEPYRVRVRHQMPNANTQEATYLGR